MDERLEERVGGLKVRSDKGKERDRVRKKRLLQGLSKSQKSDRNKAPKDQEPGTKIPRSGNEKRINHKDNAVRSSI